MVDLREYAHRFCAMALGKEKDPKLRPAFRDLDQIRADVVYPFLLEAYTDYELGTLSTDDLHEIVQMVTSYVFRRAVCRIPTNSLNKTPSSARRATVRNWSARACQRQLTRSTPSDSRFAE